MKIIMLLTNSCDPDTRVLNEAAYLTSRGDSVQILCWDKRPHEKLPSHEVFEGAEIIRFPIPANVGTGIKQLPMFFKYIKTCRKYLKENSCDFIEGHDLDGALTAVFARSRKTPFAFDMHEVYDTGNDFLSLVKRRLTYFCIKKSKAAFYENERYFDPPFTKFKNKLFRLKNYPKKEQVYFLPKTASEKFRVNYIGTAREQIPEFTALFEACKDMDDVSVNIHGNGVDQPVLQEIQHNYPNVQVHGKYDGTKEASGLYAGTDVLFCAYDPNDRNYQGHAEVVKFYEAIVTGTPMIMTAGLGMADKVIKNNWGLVCDTRNQEEIRNAVIKLKSDKALWNSIHDSLLSAAGQYSWDGEVKVLDKVFRMEQII